MSKEEIIKIINKDLGYSGRMVSGSKGKYRDSNPNNIVYFNANIFIPNYSKVWYGDIDLTEDKEILELIKQNSGKYQKEIYELYNKKIPYRTFSKKLENLEKKKLITKEEIYNRGRSTIIKIK